MCLCTLYIWFIKFISKLKKKCNSVTVINIRARRLFLVKIEPVPIIPPDGYSSSVCHRDTGVCSSLWGC